MAAKKGGPRYPKAEFTRRGHEWYDTMVKPRLKPRDKGKYVAIDIESGEFEMHQNSMTATNRLWDRLGDPQPFLIRIGYPAVGKLGLRGVRKS